MPDEWEINPNLASTVAQGGVADAQGGIAYSGVSDADTDIGGEIAFGGATADMLNYGLVNGAFSQGPFDSTAHIEPVNNPLAYWSGPDVANGGAAYAEWVVSSNTPSGYILRLVLPPGTNGETITFTQRVPLSGSGAQSMAYVARASVDAITASANVAATITVSPEDPGGSAAGTGSTVGVLGTAVDNSIAALAPGSGTIQSDAAYLTVQIGAQRMATDNTTYTVDFSDVRVDKGIPWVVVPESPGGSSTIGLVSNIGSTLRLSTLLNVGSVLPSSAVTAYLGVSSVSGVSIVGLPLSVAGKLTMSDAVILGYQTAPALGGAPAADYTGGNLVDNAGFLFVDCGGAARTFTGISATGFVEGQIVALHFTNTGGANVTLTHASAAPTSGNRFGLPGLVNRLIPANGTAWFVYNPTASAANAFHLIAVAD